MAIFKYWTEWEFETSKDTTTSFFASYSTGEVILKNTRENRRATIGYRCISLGLSKGLPLGVSQADFSDNSWGYDTLVSDRYVSAYDFDCKGYILTMGGTIGVLAGEDTGGASISILLFGTSPFAGLRCGGEFRATTPGAGVSAGLAGFRLISYA